MDLLPGLPDDVARECLIRLPLDNFSKAASVCSNWKREIKHPGFRQRRKESGLTRPVFAVAQAMVTLTRKPHGLTSLSSTQVYRVAVCDLGMGTGGWFDLPPIPEMVEGLPLFCRVVGVGSELVVIGGCDPVTWRVMNSVFVYDFITGAWRRVKDMSGEQRLFFGCASDNERFVVVAGGHDGEKNALKSALLYDVAKDDWSMLPDMSSARDECACVFHHGKFHVIGGYPTHAQGQFQRGAEVYDPATSQWRGDDGFLSASTCPSTCAEGDNERLYMCQAGNVVVKSENDTWRHVAKLPADVSDVAYLTAWRGKLIVVGNGEFGELHSTYEINLGAVSDNKESSWTKVNTPGEYSGHVQSVCCLEI